MVKSLSVMGITDSDFPMSSITGRANLLLTTSIGGGVYAGIKKPSARQRVLHANGEGKLFPLDRGWRLTADVIHHAGNAVHFVDDAVRHAA
ncbi:hypothetical protein CEW81_06590 [Kluyvera genomosp. 3]|uniref:Uncharacterized protein n=1 Tax=Kluyvera genomosp. 3 TaxID=2774055 RepID=A0A248KGI7_9ENTR|nr:hypothetical protein CEW81_06590 [Kluyvera genomosp. 3]